MPCRIYSKINNLYSCLLYKDLEGESSLENKSRDRFKRKFLQIPLLRCFCWALLSWLLRFVTFWTRKLTNLFLFRALSRGETDKIYNCTKRSAFIAETTSAKLLKSNSSAHQIYLSVFHHERCWVSSNYLIKLIR